MEAPFQAPPWSPIYAAQVRWNYQRILWKYLGDGYPGGFGGYHGA